eukprot:sb/3462535/
MYTFIDQEADFENDSLDNWALKSELGFRRAAADTPNYRRDRPQPITDFEQKVKVKKIVKSFAIRNPDGSSLADLEIRYIFRNAPNLVMLRRTLCRAEFLINFTRSANFKVSYFSFDMRCRSLVRAFSTPPRTCSICQIFLLNIEAIHSRLIKEGKISITFKSPAQMLMLSDANPSHLSLLIATISDPQHFLEMDLKPCKQPKSMQPKADVKSMTISSLKQYPSLTGVGFPKTLVNLTISNLSYRHLDTRICALPHLKTLDLSHNKLRKLPHVLWKMESLTSLNVSNNQIPGFPEGIKPSDPLCQNVSVLDLSSNLLTSFPDFLRYTKSLSCLKLNKNNISMLPNFIRNWSQTLRILEVESCNLRNLPSGLRDCYLNELKISGNPFPPPLRDCEIIKDTLHSSRAGAVGTLMSQCAKSIKRHGIKVSYSDEEILPDHVVSYTHSIQNCKTCLRLVTENCIVFYEVVELKTLAREATRLTTPVYIISFACSKLCLQRVTAGKKCSFIKKSLTPFWIGPFDVVLLSSTSSCYLFSLSVLFSYNLISFLHPQIKMFFSFSLSLSISLSRGVLSDVSRGGSNVRGTIEREGKTLREVMITGITLIILYSTHSIYCIYCIVTSTDEDYKREVYVNDMVSRGGSNVKGTIEREGKTLREVMITGITLVILYSTHSIYCIYCIVTSTDEDYKREVYVNDMKTNKLTHFTAGILVPDWLLTRQ